MEVDLNKLEPWDLMETISKFGPGFFLVVQFVLLLDFVHGWNDRCVKYDEQFWSLASCWTPPDVGAIKINCDASFMKDANEGFIGVVARNHSGQFVDGCDAFVRCWSAAQAELFAIRNTLAFAARFDLHRIIIENDNKVLMECCSSSTNYFPWEVAHLVHDFVPCNPSVSFSHVPKCCNKVADYVARLRREGNLPHRWAGCLPRAIDVLVAEDFPSSGVG